MSDNSSSEEARARFKKLASGFQPKLPRKLALLLPHKTQIEELLAMRASYDDIRILLEDADIAVSKDIAHIAVDTDNENSTLKRFHPEARFLNIADPTDIDSVFAMLDKTDLVVMDCRAASTDIFLDYFDEVRIFGLLKQFEASLNLIMPVNHETDS